MTLAPWTETMSSYLLIWVTVTSIAEHVKSNLIANLHIMVKESI